MKFKAHLMIELVIFIFLYIFFDLNSAIIIALFHFIPSIDFFMKKINFMAKLHRQLFHNIFVVIISSGIAFFSTDLVIAILATLNLILHLIMDLNGNGIMIFFPFSNYRLKFK